jgi:hypothetical protein
MPPGGARELHLRDWPFGAVGRRLLLEALLIDKQPKRGWTKGDLEARAEVAPGGLNHVLAGALQLKLVEQRQGRWYRPNELPDIAKPLKALILASGRLPDRRIDELPRRPYTRRR